MPTKAHSEQLQAFWRKHLQAWSDSKQSQVAYCRLHDLTEHQFSYWKHKLLSTDSAKKKVASGFVSVKPMAQPAPGLSLTLPSGLVIQGIDQHNLQLVSQLLRQL